MNDRMYATEWANCERLYIPSFEVLKAVDELYRTSVWTPSADSPNGWHVKWGCETSLTEQERFRHIGRGRLLFNGREFRAGFLGPDKPRPAVVNWQEVRSDYLADWNTLGVAIADAWEIYNPQRVLYVGGQNGTNR